MASLVKLNLHSFFNSDKYSRQTHADLADYIERRLRNVARGLEDNGFYFEAANALNLADRLGDFVEEDGDADEFASIWNDIEDWAGVVVDHAGRTKSLCDLPVLPDQYTC